jgi:cytochrome P450
MSELIDWSSDYDIFSKDYIENPFDIWDGLRDTCPIAHTGRHSGSWLPTTYDDVTNMARDPETFSSREILVVPRVTGGYGDDVASVPIQSDAPLHTWTRRQLLPTFSPKAVDELEVFTRAWCRELMDSIAGRESADAAVEYAQQIPAQIIATMLGVPTTMRDQFTTWVRNTLEAGLTDIELRLQARKELLEFFGNEMKDRRTNGYRGDLISELMQSEHDGEPIPDNVILGMCNLLLVAGVDTTWSGIGASMWHLATHPEDRRRLVEEPELIPSAVEEFLRAYSPVTMARIVTKDVEYNGCPFKEGDRILMAFPAANRDPKHFENPDEVIIDRQHNRHVAFGAGIHRCVGSNLARMEMRVAIEEWLARVPDFELSDASAVTWAGGQVRGPRSIPVRILKSNER